MVGVVRMVEGSVFQSLDPAMLKRFSAMERFVLGITSLVVSFMERRLRAGV